MYIYIICIHFIYLCIYVDAYVYVYVYLQVYALVYVTVCMYIYVRTSGIMSYRVITVRSLACVQLKTEEGCHGPFRFDGLPEPICSSFWGSVPYIYPKSIRNPTKELQMGVRVDLTADLRRPPPPSRRASTTWIGLAQERRPIEAKEEAGLLLPTPPNVPLLRAIWSVFDGIWGLLMGSWGVLVRILI